MTDQDSGVGRRLSALPHGLYEQLETPDLRERIARARDVETEFAEVAADALPHHLATHLHGLLRRALQGAATPDQRLEIAARVIAALGADYASDTPVRRDDGSGSVQLLHEVRPADALRQAPTGRPATPLSDVALLTNAAGEPSIGSEIREELASADAVDLLCAFVKWHGLRTLERELAALAERGVPFRVITTTYMGATERRALDRVVREFGGQVRVNYSTASTRLHAKAWLFHRATGWSTAYVGSSNLSRAAMLDGLEWNVRLSSIATPSLLGRFQATFDTYWADPAFDPYGPERDAQRLDRELERASLTGRPRDASTGDGPRIELAGLEVHPYPHQARMLDDLHAERSRGRHRNLLVAATGTGKTVIAALDHRDLTRAAGAPLSLLFVAHRREILDQALETYRAVLDDGSFGELFVGDHRPRRWRHVFASVQSLRSLGVESLDPQRFDVVVIDEFHHASASSYRALLEHLQPRELLGLTATPERSDGLDVKELFDGRVASEMRLWDALEADILVPFHYFAIHDDVDLRRVPWRGGRYDVAALGRIYTGDEARARKILAALRDKTADTGRLKALGFCASVEHARFMAEVFTRAGLPSAAVVGETGARDRAAAFAGLRDGSLKVLFGVDVFNEGVDIPDVNTVLFLRPTHSATVFLQQLGRGLRRHPDKDVLTALDFVGHHRAEFRVDLVLRALTGTGRKRLVDDVERGFPHLPPGSQIVLDEVAQQRILENIRQQVGLNRNQLAQDVRQHAQAAGAAVAEYPLTRYLAESGRELSDVYRVGKGGRSWTTVREQALGAPLRAGVSDEDRAMTLRAVTLRHVDDPDRAAAYLRLLTEDASYEELTSRDQQFARMLHFTVLHGQRREPFASYTEALRWARGLPLFVEEVIGLLEHLAGQSRAHPAPMGLDRPTVLLSHAHYRRTEILAGLDISSWESPRSRHVEGVDYSRAYNADVFLVTLDKDARFSPSTMYRDYALSRQLFHWESQNNTASSTPQGKRYLAKQRGESHTVMFVRGAPKDAVGDGAAFLNMGTVQFREWSGTERPMQITWELDREMPAAAYQEAKAAG